jgi:hypothetical protein
MSKKSLYYLAGGLGATIGGFVPSLWGGSDFSGWAILTSLIGGIGGIWAVAKFY